MKRLDRSLQSDLLRDGYAFQNRVVSKQGSITRVWGRFPEPIPLYFQVSNQDLVSVLAGQLGIADISTGDSEFDRLFIVRSNNAELAKKILTPELRGQLLEHQRIRYRTGSLDGLLGVDYLRDLKQGRNLREFWMLDVGYRLERNSFEPYLRLAQTINQSVREASKDWRSTQDRERSHTAGFLEGR